MINRVLIRIKVIQLLYSYLLVDKNFTLESQPSAPTKEKRMAYQLYLDTIVLMCRIAESIRTRNTSASLAETRFVKNVLTDDRIKGLMQRYRTENYIFEPIEARLTEAVKESSLYKQFQKNPENERIWEDIFNLIIFPDKQYNQLIENYENFSLRGVERMQAMMKDTFSNFFASQMNVTLGIKELRKSLDKARELYFRLLLLPVDLVEAERRDQEERRNRFIVRDEDKNPNTKFIDNLLTREISDNPKVREFAEKNNINWLSEEPQLLRSILRTIKESPVYEEYLATPAAPDFENLSEEERREARIRQDTEFWRKVCRKIIFQNESFLEYLEDKSVFWNDDIDIIGTFVLKSLRRFEEHFINPIQSPEPVMEMYKDDEDAVFGEQLYSYIIRNRMSLREMIDKVINTSKWDSERLAFMDVLITMAATAEILEYPKIPVNVSINEYIEIAKCYSTSKSGAFVNGIMGAIVENLRSEGKINK